MARQELPADGVEELLREELVEPEGDRLALTSAGRAEAAQVIRRTRLAERLLADVLQTEQSLLAEQACRLEHALVDGIDDSICTLLGHPRFCPHGKPVPPGECCRQMRQSVERLIAPLSDLQVGQRGQIAYLRVSDPQRAQKLMAMGVLPGVPVTLVHRSPSLVFEAGYSQFAVDEEIAGDIFVRLARPSAAEQAEAGPMPRRQGRWRWRAGRLGRRA
jgi:DtxR family Mn-dependent transcriptional regulator